MTVGPSSILMSASSPDGDEVAVGRRHGELPDRLHALAIALRPAHRQVVVLLALVHLRQGGAAERRLDHVVDVAGVEPVALAGDAVDGDLDVGLPERPEDAEILHARDGRHDRRRSPSTSASFTSRLGPTTLTEFSPLTPLMASSTLSEMYWEKLKMTPGNSFWSSSVISWVSLSLVSPRGHSSKGLQRREELQVVELREIGAVVRAAELRDDPRDLGVLALRHVAGDGRLQWGTPGGCCGSWARTSSV